MPGEKALLATSNGFEALQEPFCHVTGGVLLCLCI